MTAYNRGQVLYRLAEMIEARTASSRVSAGREEVERTVDRIVWYAGWADKLAQVLGSSMPVSGPYSTSAVPGHRGRRVCLRRTSRRCSPPFRGSFPPCIGGTAVVRRRLGDPPAGCIELAEALATSDVPGGDRQSPHSVIAMKLRPWLASHMDVSHPTSTGADGTSADRRAFLGGGPPTT